MNTMLQRILKPILELVIGAQIGSAVARYIPQRTLMISMGILFVLVAALLLGEVGLKIF